MRVAHGLIPVVRSKAIITASELNGMNEQAIYAQKNMPITP
jgi:hypothetical protein